MAEKIKNLTDLISDGTVSSELSCGKIALENKIYDQAWEHLEKAYSSLDATTEQIGEACYNMYIIMKEISSNDPLIEKLKNTDADLKRIGKSKPLTNEYVRKYIGRKYLKNSAECDYKQGLIEYGLSCVGCGDKNAFVYECNEANLDAGIAWAERMLKYDDRDLKHTAHIIYSKYYFVKCVENPLQSYVRGFGNHILEARNIKLYDEYTNYFLGHLYANPMFSKYSNGSYYNIKEGYNLFYKVIRNGKDPSLVSSARDIYHMIETKFPRAIR